VTSTKCLIKVRLLIKIISNTMQQPGEIYWPNYSTQMAYVRALNAASVSEVGQIQSLPAANAVGQPHRYARTAFAATAMPYSAFSTMQDVANNQIVLSPAALAQALLIGRRLPPPPATAPTSEQRR
jgi:hypothetical protein